MSLDSAAKLPRSIANITVVRCKSQTVRGGLFGHVSFYSTPQVLHSGTRVVPLLDTVEQQMRGLTNHADWHN